MRLLQQALTFDDVLLVPAHSNVLPREVSLKHNFLATSNLTFLCSQQQWTPSPKRPWQSHLHKKVA